VAATAALGCTKLISGMCDVESDCAGNSLGKTHCEPSTKTCIFPTGGAGGAAGSAGGMAGAAGSKAGAGGAVGGAGGAGGGAGGAAGAKFTCASCGGSKPFCDVDAGACRSCGQVPGSCGGSKPICDVDAGTCRSCGQVPGSCGSPDGGTPVCVSADAGVNPGMCVGCLADTNCKGTTPICELGADAGAARDTCRGCTGTTDCTQHDATTPVCVTATNAAGGAQPGTCVGCVANGNCGGGKPICELTTTNAGATVNTCRACAMDTECGGPGVCMADGHCAGPSEVWFVDETATGCTGAVQGTGSQTNPFCYLSLGLGAIQKGQNVLVILGAVGGRVSLTTTGGVNPVIIGRKDATGAAAVIPATTGAAISVSSDTVIIRDITLSGGLTAPGTRGLLATGSANVTLLRVIVNLGLGGPGVDAETGATLTMDECYLANNPVGGILVNGATATIQNTLIAANPSASGYGVQFNAPGSNTVFAFNTIAGYATAATSDLSHQVTLSDSIVLGPTTNCDTSTCVTTASQTQPSFTTTVLQNPNPYHLTAHLACPGAQPTTFPDHDIDGDPRTSTKLDCGADQLVP
jgi:hypothetical protein